MELAIARLWLSSLCMSSSLYCHARAGRIGENGPVRQPAGHPTGRSVARSLAAWAYSKKKKEAATASEKMVGRRRAQMRQSKRMRRAIG